MNKTGLKKSNSPAPQRGFGMRKLSNKGASFGSKGITKAAPPAKNASLLNAAKAAAQSFQILLIDYAEAKEGYRTKLYDFAAHCYKVGLGFMNDLDQFDLFKADAFWADARQKPKNDKIMKAVVTFAMNAKSMRLPSRVSKTAKVLESLAEQKINVNVVATHLKDGGGIEKMYAALSPNRNENTRVRDDVEMLDPNVAEDDEGGRDEDAEGAKESDPDWDFDKPTAAAHATDGDIKITDVGGTASPPTSPSLRFDPSKHLLVDLSSTDVTPDAALDMETLCIMAIVGPADELGWRSVKAKSVRPAARISGLRKKPSVDESPD